MRMPLRLTALFWWVLAVYFIRGELTEYLLATDKMAFLSKFGEIHQIRLLFTGLIAFGSYSFMTYLILWYARHRWPSWVKAAAIVVGSFACIGFRAILEEGILVWLTGLGNYYDGLSWGYYVVDNSLYAIIFTVVGLVFFFSQESAFNEKLVQRREKVQRETELKFLRSQLNPHFLFNTLNNVYSLVSEGSPKALPALEKLSALLRYALYTGERTVELNEEIQYLRDFIHLESLRTEDIARVDLRVGPFHGNWCLPVMLLVPFVENAFKHGELRRENDPLVVHLGETERGKLDFKVSNVKKDSQVSKDALGGIGITNVRKRLELLYPGSHALKIYDEDEHFCVHLSLWATEPVRLDVLPPQITAV